MFLKPIYSLLTIRSLNCHLFNQIVKNRSIISRCRGTGCLTTSAVISNNKTIEDQFIANERTGYLNERQNPLKDMDLNDKQLNDLFAVKAIDGLSEEVDYELLDQISPVLGKSFNLSTFADKSTTIQMFVKLGVDLSHIEKKNPQIAGYLLGLDFEEDIKPYIRFLVDEGVDPKDLGYILTRNPIIFRHHLDDLEVRVNYLKSKRFDDQMIASVLTKAPKFLNIKTKVIDYKLAFLQKEFHLTADEVRQLIANYPRIALLNDMSYREMSFLFKEEFGFNSQEIKQMLLKSARIFRQFVCDQKNHRIAVLTFDLIHNDMKIPHELIAKTPQLLHWRYSTIDCRHRYLKLLGRDQYDPKQPLYVPLSAFCELEDNEFCDKYAKTSVQDFNRFCKTL